MVLHFVCGINFKGSMKVQSASVELKDGFMYNTYEYLSTSVKKEGDRYLA